jgi:hypothetical protein
MAAGGAVDEELTGVLHGMDGGLYFGFWQKEGVAKRRTEIALTPFIDGGQVGSCEETPSGQTSSGGSRSSACG